VGIVSIMARFSKSDGYPNVEAIEYDRNTRAFKYGTFYAGIIPMRGNVT
jgi:hypothetical protein